MIWLIVVIALCSIGIIFYIKSLSDKSKLDAPAKAASTGAESK